MPIPPFNEHGLLPEGIHDCTLAEIEARLGGFQGSDRRLQLWARFKEFIREARASGLVLSILVNGSFVTGDAAPNDIDLIIIVPASHDYASELRPVEYNVVSKGSVRRRFGFDLLLAREDSDELRRYARFFQQVRFEPEKRKGILRITL